MNILPVNNANTSFGKISWGAPETAKKTASALIELKEANDINGQSLLKFNEVIEQMQILSEHPDTFKVACSVIEGYHDKSFIINVFEDKTQELLVSTSEPFSADYINKGQNKPIKNNIKSLAQNVLTKHQSLIIKSEVETIMKNLGKIFVRQNGE